MTSALTNDGNRKIRVFTDLEILGDLLIPEGALTRPTEKLTWTKIQALVLMIPAEEV